jgi:hypothetical protein
MFSRSFRLSLLAGLPATMALAGPLDPPAGPVTSTLKTLSEVEPRTAVNAANTPGDFQALYVISSPGSYYLTANVPSASRERGASRSRRPTSPSTSTVSR